MQRYVLFLVFFLALNIQAFAQKKILFDATKSETAGNADWVIDADSKKYGVSHAQRFPTPDQSGITASTDENYWTGGISAWAVDAVKAGFYVETLPYGTPITYGDVTNVQDLSNYDMYVVCEPNNPFSQDEKRAITEFVRDGGVLFMIADHVGADRDGDGWDAVDVWNDFEKNNPVEYNPFGITFEGDITESAGKIKYPDDPVIKGPYGTVSYIEFYGGATIVIDKNSNPDVRGIIYRNQSNTDYNNNILVATARYGKGYVFAIGDSSPIDDGSGDPSDNLYDGWLGDASGNHRILIMNATFWALNYLSPIEQVHNDSFKVLNNGSEIVFEGNIDHRGYVYIYDITGHMIDKVHMKNGYAKTKVLTRGTYVYKFVSENNLLITGKFVVW